VKTPIADLQLQFNLSKTVDGLLRELAAMRNGATGDRLAAIQQAYQPLPALFTALQQSDARPTAAQEAAVADAVAKVAALR